MRTLFTTLLAGVFLLLAACGGGGGGGSPNGTYSLTVYAADGTTPLAGAHVDIFDADNLFVATKATSDTGLASFRLRAGVYGARVSAQGFSTSPPAGVAPTPFTVTARQTLTATLALDALADPSAVAMIHGNADVAGVLVVAVSTLDDTAVSGLTDADGNYALFNVPPGIYDVTGFRAGYLSDTVTQSVAALDDATVDLAVTAHAGATLGGHLTFLATANGVVDILLLHPATRDAIPGLRTQNNGTSYTLRNVPVGDYLAWATFANDGYVMDPDWIDKNGGYPDALAVTIAAGTQVFDFSITDAVPLVSPTNEADAVVPSVVETLAPTFTWSAYPSAQQYVVEVLDVNGNTIWGGYTFNVGTQDATFHHPYIGTATSAVFDFDSSASEPLVDGGIYLWRVHAFKDTENSDPDRGWVAISSSEQQMGLFRVALPVPPPP